MSKVKTKEWYEERLADMIDMRQMGISLTSIGIVHDICPKYASRLLCQAGVYERKPRKPAPVPEIPKAAPAVPVKVGRWTLLAGIFASVIKRFTR